MDSRRQPNRPGRDTVPILRYQVPPEAVLPETQRLSLVRTGFVRWRSVHTRAR